MASFNIIHIFPDNRLHILNGYNDVIKTLIWGLRCYGHDVTYNVNHFCPGVRNIVFGANWLGPRAIGNWTPDTIIYNLEQIDTIVSLKRFKVNFKNLARRFEIWDYSQRNIGEWKKINPGVRVHFVPIGYAPGITFERPGVKQDIDVLFYGDASDKRLSVFKSMCKVNLTSMYVFGLYADARDDLIARSKIVLNIHQDNASIFSIVRVSYLLANRKVVMTDLPPGLEIEPDIAGAVVVAPVNLLDNFCWQLAQNDALRHQLEETAFKVMAARDIRTILAHVLTNEQA